MSVAGQGLLGGSLQLSAEGLVRFERVQVQGVYAHVARAAIISSVLAVALAIYLTPVFGAVQTHGWVALKIIVSAVRLCLALAYTRTDAFAGKDRLARRLMLAALAVDGAVWGFPGVWSYNAAGESTSLVVACLASVALLATNGLGSDAKATFAYVVPMLLPVAIAMPFRGDSLGLFAAAGIFLVLVQAGVTGIGSERRLRREAAGAEAMEQALSERSSALDEAARQQAAVETALREVKKQSAVKALFLGTMSHELRTPLHGILGLTQLVRQQIVDPAIQHKLGLVESSGSHLLELIGALLDVSRIDSGRLELHPTTFDLASELRNLVELYEIRCQGKGIEFRGMVEIEARCMVRGDAARLRQVLHNLLGNAVKFTEQGLIAFRAVRSGELITFTVTDTGPGIAAKDLPTIFEAFNQVDNSATRPADGSGLGLTIARELAHAMGGDIQASSAVGVGSRFTFTARLPAPLDTEPSELETLVPVPNLRSGFRVLVVEDNEVNALIAQAHLQNIGAEVTRAHDGQEAVTLAFSEPRPDFVLMDNRMPVMDGPTATRKIRLVERQARLKRIPIVALTASPNEEDRQDCYASGMDGLLMKPFTATQLLQAIAIYARGDGESGRHPLYEFAASLEDMEPDLLGGVPMH
jgi:signal transduction histidine kinase/ActR/RegA family two-component response regulator